MTNKGYLSPDEIKLFYQQGYFLQRAALTSDEVDSLQQRIRAIIALSRDAINQLPLSPEEGYHFMGNGARVVYRSLDDRTHSIARINGVSGIDPSLLQFVRSDKLVRTFFDILGTSDLEHLINQLHPKLPGDGIEFPQHRDIQFRRQFDPEWKDVLGNGSYAICIMPVEPMSQLNGGLWIDSNNYPSFKGEQENRVYIQANPGDLLFMHPYVSHGSYPNHSLASRHTLLSGFCAFGANHKAYPGTDVNIRLTLQQDGSIAHQASPWSDHKPTGEANH